MNDYFVLYSLEVSILDTNGDLKLVSFECNTEELFDWILRCKYQSLTIVSKRRVYLDEIK